MLFNVPLYSVTALFCSLTLLVKTATNLQSKLDQVIPVLKARAGPAIIYVTLQKQAQDIALILQKSGISADAYHAGLKTEERKRVQDAFALSQDGIVSTVAHSAACSKFLISRIGCCNYCFWVRPCLYYHHRRLTTTPGRMGYALYG
jgi:hypothetical protein